MQRPFPLEILPFVAKLWALLRPILKVHGQMQDKSVISIVYSEKKFFEVGRSVCHAQSFLIPISGAARHGGGR